MSDAVRTLEECLRDLAVAYPEDIFPPPPPGEHGRTVDQCSAAMGRHFSPIFLAAAERITALEAERHPHPGEVLYMFMGWLTTRELPVSLGAEFDAAPAADLVSTFLDANHVPPLPDDWSKTTLLVHPEEDDR